MKSSRNIKPSNFTLRLNCVVIFLLLILTSKSYISQSKNEIIREVEINNQTFTESFEYSTSNNQLIKNGQYKLYNVENDSLNNLLFKSSVLNGNFKNNEPDGIWTISKGNYEMTKEIIFDNRTYAYKTNGFEFSAKGNFENGKKVGIWNFNNWEVKSSNVTDTLSHVSMNFNNDKIAGKIVFEDKDFFIEINLDENGFAQGKWSYYQYNDNKKKLLRKELIFENNTLKEKVLYDFQKTHQIVFDNESIDNLNVVTLPLDANFFRILKLKTIISNQNSIFRNDLMDETNQLYLESIHFINSLDSIFKIVSKSSLTPNIKVNLHQYNFSKNEIEFFDILAFKVKQIDSTLNSVFSDPQIKLAKISNQNIYRNLSILKAIDSSIIKPIDSIVNLYQNGTLAYLNRNLLVNYFLNLNHKIDISFDNQTEAYHYDPNSQFNSTEPIENLIFFFDEIQSEITSVLDQIEKFIFQVRKENRLVEKESQLLKLYEKIIYLNDNSKSSQLNDLAGFDVNIKLKHFIDTELKNYNELINPSEKMKMISSYISCFENIDKLILSLQKVPKQKEFIKEKYVKNVFNPYISDYMEEVNKPNIYNTFNNELLPKIFEQLKSMNCYNTHLVSKNFENSYNGMLRILDEDTRKIERKVKKEKDPVKISELLNFNLIFE